MAGSIQECYAGTHLIAQEDPRKSGHLALAEKCPNP